MITDDKKWDDNTAYCNYNTTILVQPTSNTASIGKRTNKRLELKSIFEQNCTVLHSGLSVENSQALKRRQKNIFENDSERKKSICFENP